ncbi:zinc-ribbon domain-containing protein [Mariniluteicoccus flavus]
MIIFGTAGYAKVLGVMMALCGRCNNHAEHHVVKRGTKFSLFFIPLFPVSGHYALECGICGQQRRLTKDEAESLAAGHGQQQVPQQGYAPQQGYDQQPQQHNPWQNLNQPPAQNPNDYR